MAAPNLVTNRPDLGERINHRTILRIAYLSSIGFIFVLAFASYYVQFPGLLSSSGLEPVERVLPYVFPNLHQNIVAKLWIDADSLCEIVAIAGIALSILAASGVVHHGSLFTVLTLLYCFLHMTGGTFYSFQWDILLIESGFVTAVCCAPWDKLRYGASRRSRGQDTLGAWGVRFLLFKLMFMSGVVKIQANCPTWLNLTALEFHFATQCLPGPFAWHAHQLHPFFLRLSVAATFIIEIPAAFLLIAPAVTIRKIGAYLQIVLQIMIIVTGNYNFFNLLTMALCLPCLESDEDFDEKVENTKREGNENVRYNFSGENLRFVQHLCSWAFLGWASYKMFEVHVVSTASQVGAPESFWSRLAIKLVLTKDSCDELIDESILLAIQSTLAFLIASSFKALWKQRPPLARCNVILRLVVCALCIGVVSIPLLSLTPELKSKGFIGSDFFSRQWVHARAYRLSNGYGLFRRMTGVGSKSLQLQSSFGWAGLPPSVVERPEIILEGVYDDNDNSTWHELNFRWKPGNVAAFPSQVAPHQPRLDWQMWFAALGRYQNNPWLINLMDKMLDSCGPVLDLMDEPQLRSGRRNLKAIRARLWHYDFTRIDTEWTRRIPGVEVIPYKAGASWLVKMMHWPEKIWKREYVGEYIPSLTKDNPSVLDFLSRQGYKKTCLDAKERCNTFSTNSMGYFCNVARLIRTKQNVAGTWVFGWLAFLLAYRFNLATKRSGDFDECNMTEAADIAEKKRA